VSLKGILDATKFIILRPQGLQQSGYLEKQLNKAVGPILADAKKFRSNEQSKKEGCLIGQLNAKESDHFFDLRLERRCSDIAMAVA
jgi:hypothetical protein